jgi:hypothetical protein
MFVTVGGRGMGSAALCAVLCLGLFVAGVAGAGSVPLPQVPVGKGNECVRETEFMRRNHMQLLLHQRDATMHEGIRTPKYSLKECINCHAATDVEEGHAKVARQQHFCVACHAYAGIEPDCFQCHSMKPEESASVR